MLAWYMNSNKEFKWLDMGKIVLGGADLITVNFLTAGCLTLYAIL